jgi:CHAT domain-containing protein/tetratricopeptide (TPR) repeat protein
MKVKKQILRFVIICIFIYVACRNQFLLHANSIFTSCVISSGTLSGSNFADSITGEIDKLNRSLLGFLTIDDLRNSKLVVERLIQKSEVGNVEEKVLYDSYYYIGIYFLKSKNINEAIRYLNLCKSLKEKNKEIDLRYYRVLYNISVAYAIQGDLNKFESYANKSLETGKLIFNEDSPDLLFSYLSLVSAYIDQKEYEKAISNSNIAIAIANKHFNTISLSIIAPFYYDLGVCYDRLADFSKAKIYFDKTESIIRNSGIAVNDDYINLMNGLAITCNALGMTEESGNYYDKGVKLAVSMNSPLAYNLINSYSVFLAKNGKVKEGEKLLRNSLERSKTNYGSVPDVYYEVLMNYANFLKENKIDLKKSLSCFEDCIAYIKKNDQNTALKTSVFIGYSLALESSGEPEKALEVIQSLIFPAKINSIYLNPIAEELKPDVTSLRILKVKYDLLLDVFNKSTDRKALEAAAQTSELIISMLDKVRINISEEESRLILGDKYRDSYLNAIHDFNLLYNKTSDYHFLEKAFEYSERSKVAGLLTSTRELKASQFHIPSDIGNFERDLQREIGLLNAHISEESSSLNPNSTLIAKWKENLLNYTRKRDSLVVLFEKQFPDYYAIKYNTHILSLKDIPSIIGRDENYINYIVSGNSLYTFVVNRKHQQLLSVAIDSSFFKDVRSFRRLLSMPSSGNESKNFNDFQSVGLRLYKILVEPVRNYLISDKVVISPDNYLSYLPFETIPTTTLPEGEIKYKNLHYLMNDLDISYTYSATFMAESIKGEFISKNKLIAFAPDYPEPIDIQSALMSRQAGMGKLMDLPFARQEAAYVSDITGGKLYENSDATESVFKRESGKYDIIHLAMHTILNDKDPMRSTLIFSHEKDSINDGYLKTYEIYGVPLKAEMVVLSSCNTGSGQLNSGEGILSLARGFIYSGSQSVVMSMWEIEDRSGTDIVKMFYSNLKKGYSKSIALKRARISFLKKSDNLRSHPYFWSTLVIYGNNSPLYRSKMLITLAIAGIIIFALGGYYFWKRKYS